MSPTQNTEDDQDEDGGAIGVYYLSPSETSKPAEERTYEQDALWTPEGWAETSNGETIEDAPEERTLESFESHWAGSRHFYVFRPDDVPGEVEETEPVVSAEDMGLEDELR